MFRYLRKVLPVTLLFCLVAADAPLQAQPWGGWYEPAYEPPKRDIFPSSTFTFCRGEFTSTRGWDRWRIDYPESDLNFSLRLSQITTIEVNRTADGGIEHAVVKLDDPVLFSYPFLYMVEVGDLHFSDAEIEGLRQYLLRGGFLMVDDFWGDAAWENWAYEIGRVLPPDEYPIVDIPLDHDIFNIVFQVTEMPQVMAVGYYRYWQVTGNSYEEEYPAVDKRAHCRGIFDKNGRLVAVFTHNTDLGDGWEREGDNEGYFRDFSAKKAYPMGINIITYAMTH